MRIVFQLPIADFRAFLVQGPAVSGPRVPGAIVEPNRQGSIVDSLSYFGSAERRSKGADEAFPDDTCFYSAHNALRFVSLGQQTFARRQIEIEKKISSYRRLFVSDKELTGKVTIRVEVGLALTAKQEPMDFDGLIQLLKAVPSLTTEIGAMRAFDLEALGSAKLREIAGRRPLVQQGKYLAAHFALATSQWSTGDHHRAVKLVRHCQPVLVAELRSEEFKPSEFTSNLPYFRHLEHDRTAGADVWFGQLCTDDGVQIPTWILGARTTSRDVVRRLRLCLLRLHAEHQVLEQTLRWFENEPGDKLELPSLKTYFRYAWEKIVCREKRAELNQSAIMEALAAAAAIRPEAEADYIYLKKRLANARQKVDQEISSTPKALGKILPSPVVSNEWVGWLERLETKPDLTIVIQGGSGPAEHELFWNFSTPHTLSGIGSSANPSEPLQTVLLQPPSRFAETLRNGIQAVGGGSLLFFQIQAAGTSIGALVPPEIWRLLWSLSRELKRRPNVLLLSSEMHIPWELARDSGAGGTSRSFLGAEATVGRWLLPRGGVSFPPTNIEISTAALVVGRYRGTGSSSLRNLPGARREVRDISGILVRSGRTIRVKTKQASFDEIRRCLIAYQPVQLLHFAVHGKFDADNYQNGLLMVDGRPLGASAVEGLNLKGNPFVFLNACEAGAGNLVLGSSGGLAEAFVKHGASAVVAPFWAVEDAEAGRIAIDLYKNSFCDGKDFTVAELLRRERESFEETNVLLPRVAYKFFGHPNLRLALSA